jgi:hypothetical protein
MTALKRISIPEIAHRNACCVIKDSQQGGEGDLFQSWNNVYRITSVVTVQAKDAARLYEDCGFSSVKEQKDTYMNRHNFAPKQQEIMYAHYFEEVE